MKTEPITRQFPLYTEAAADADSRGVAIWEHHSFSQWAQECGQSRYVTGSYDGLIRDLGYGSAGSYVLVTVRKRNVYAR